MGERDQPATESNCRSELVQGLDPVSMTYFNSQTICGKQTNLNFLHATRVDPATMQCPGVYEPCSEETSPENTICVHPENRDSHCPITFIDVVYEPPGPLRYQNQNETASADLEESTSLDDSTASSELNETAADASNNLTYSEVL